MASESSHTEEVESPDIHFEPIIQLPTVEIVTLEEEEDQIIELRAKLFRFDSSFTPAEWKERGTGTVKLLKHKTSGLVRVLMRRDKTHKICANHYVQPEMELKPNCGSDRAWIWNTNADFSDDEAKPELLAIRFSNAENAQKFKEKFTEAQDIMKTAIPKHNAEVSKAVADEPGEPKENGVVDKSAGDDVKTSGGDDVKTADNLTDDKKESKTSENENTESVTEKLDNLTVKDGNSETVANKTDDDKSEKTTDEEKKD